MTYVLWTLLLLAQIPGNRPPTPEPWYQQVFDAINPADIDYGAIWEARKEALIDTYLVNPYFQYSVWTTLGLIFLMLLLYIQELSHRRSMRMAVRSMVHIRRHDAYARGVAREAIRRYNERIEACNRILEAGDSQTSELEALKQEHQKTVEALAASHKEAKDLRTLAEERSAKISELSRTLATQPHRKNRPANRPTPPEHLGPINKLERDLSAERQKNRRVKGTRLDVGDR